MTPPRQPSRAGSKSLTIIHARGQPTPHKLRTRPPDPPTKPITPSHDAQRVTPPIQPQRGSALAPSKAQTRQNTGGLPFLLQIPTDARIPRSPGKPFPTPDTQTPPHRTQAPCSLHIANFTCSDPQISKMSITDIIFSEVNDPSNAVI